MARYYADGKFIGNNPPDLATQAISLMHHAVATIRNTNRVSPEEKARRLAICHACEFLIHKEGKSDRCGKCGCFLKWKTALESWHCPIKKW